MLGIHAPDAVVDFDYRAGRMVPRKARGRGLEGRWVGLATHHSPQDGVVVPAEAAETLDAAWAQAAQAEAEKEEEARQARVLANWLSLGRRALIYMRLKRSSDQRKAADAAGEAAAEG